MNSRYITFAVSIITLAILLYKVDVQEVIAIAASTHLGWFFATVLVSLIAQAIAGIRLGAICGVLNRKVGTSLALRAHFVGLWFNQILPTGMGGDVVRLTIFSKCMGWRRAIRAILLDRVYGLALLVVVLTIQAPIYVLLFGDVTTTRIAFLTSAIVVLGIVVALMAPDSRALHRIAPPAGRFLLLMARDFRRAIRMRLDSILVVSSIAFLALSILCFGLSAKALGVDIRFYNFLMFVPLIFIVMQIPISWGGWGPREAATIMLFSEIGVSSEKAFVIALLFGVVMTLSALPGLGMLSSVSSAPSRL